MLVDMLTHACTTLQLQVEPKLGGAVIAMMAV